MLLGVDFWPHKSCWRLGGVEERGLLAVGSFVWLWAGSWTTPPPLWGWGWMRPRHHGTLGTRALGRQKCPWGAFS